MNIKCKSDHPYKLSNLVNQCIIYILDYLRILNINIQTDVSNAQPVSHELHTGPIPDVPGVHDKQLVSDEQSTKHSKINKIKLPTLVVPIGNKSYPG